MEANAARLGVDPEEMHETILAFDLAQEERA
jgi:hypothetical protein